MGQNLIIVEDSRVTIDGTVYRVDKCCICGCSDVYIHHRGGKYQIKCWWDTTCRNRSGWYESLLDALDVWNERVGVLSE